MHHLNSLNFSPQPPQEIQIWNIKRGFYLQLIAENTLLDLKID